MRKIIKERLDETEKQFQAMLELRNNMSKALKQWDNMADKAPSKHMVCHLVESFEYGENSCPEHVKRS